MQVGTDVKVMAFIAMVTALSIPVWDNDGEARSDIASDVAESITPPGLRSGDLVFRAGRGIFSDLFRNIGEYRAAFSHVGIVYYQGGRAYVLHTEASELTGIGHARRDSLKDFIGEENASAYGFYRVEGLNEERRRLVVDKALQYVREQVPFDVSFDLNTDDKLYCSELVYKAFRAAKMDLVDAAWRFQVFGWPETGSREVISISQLISAGNIHPIVDNKQERKNEKVAWQFLDSGDLDGQWLQF